MYLFFFSTDDMVNNNDWFIVAPDLLTACALWLKDVPDILHDRTDNLPKVFKVPTNCAAYPKARALSWHTDVSQICDNEVETALSLCRP